MIPRLLASHLTDLANWFPVVSVTGPRQSGKTTLIRDTFNSYQYVNLEDVQLRQEAQADPNGFIMRRAERLIVDEAQYAPELFSAIQLTSDRVNLPGQYILFGSQNFLLLKQIQQSLAGRVAILKLLPLSYRELADASPGILVSDFMLRGGYPRLYTSPAQAGGTAIGNPDSETEPQGNKQTDRKRVGAKRIPPRIFFDSYFNTYIARDVGEFLNIRQLSQFTKFLHLCAERVGSLVNYTNLANEAEITVTTARQWFSLLESSYILFQLTPYSTSKRKRLTKSPKLYFYDNGLLSYLLGYSPSIQVSVQVDSGGDLQSAISPPHDYSSALNPATSMEISSEDRGKLFENLIVSETLKHHLNQGQTPALFFYRDDSKVEVDLLDYTNPHAPELIEIKSSQTYREKFASHLQLIGSALEVDATGWHVVSQAPASYNHQGINVWAASDWLTRS